MTRLNITNGDGAARLIRQSGVEGEVLPWRDPMHHGPFPAGLNLAELSTRRARYLVGPDADPAEAERVFCARDQELEDAGRHDAVTLWFEHDLLDQLQILQILDGFVARRPDRTRLEIICIDRFPGVAPFRGLGQLTPDDIASLMDSRRPVTEAMLDLAVSGWAAFRSDDPNDLLDFVQGDLSALPFLEAALRRHFEEFPDAVSGLSRTETQLLRLMAEGVHAPDQLFLRNMEMETALYIGDWPTYRVIDELCRGGLVACNPAPFTFPPVAEIERADFNAQTLCLTETGRRVLEGTQDAFDQMKRDGWLGGVCLMEDGALWTFDRQDGAFRRRVC